MFNKDEITTYYILNLSKDNVCVIDANNYSLIKNIEIAPRPHEIIVDEENNIYIASDRKGIVTFIKKPYEVRKIWDMPNNGRIRVDSNSQVIYVCDTEEVGIYSLKTGEKIKTLKGFFIADGLELDKDKKRLFVLDIFQREIKVYDTINFTLIKSYKNVGQAPVDILIDKFEEYIYIANKEVNKVDKFANISILDINSGEVSYIYLDQDSNITSIDQSERFIYAANKGLGRVEVIDILKGKAIASIETTLEEVQKVKVEKDRKILLAISKNNEGNAVIDKIDLNSNSIINSFNFDGENNIIFDIGIVKEKKIKIKEDYFLFNKSPNKEYKEKGVTLLAKKIISTYQEKLILSEVVEEVLKNNDQIIEVEDIIFKKCEVIEESKNRKKIENRKDYSILTYDFNLPYYISIKENLIEKHLIKGVIKGSQRTSLYIPKDIEEKGFEISITSDSKLISTPVIIDKVIKFNISTLISTKVIVEEDVFIPFCKNCEEIREAIKSD